MKKELTNKENFTKGLLRENPVFVLLLGLCPTLGVTTSAINGLGMGLATLFVLLMSNVVISLVRNLIPAKVRIPSFIVIIASFVTVVDLVMAGYTPALHEQLGLFIPLIVVNCIVLGRAEAFASKHPTKAALIDGLGMGVGFTFALTLLGAIRELLGDLSLFGIKLMEADGMILFILAPGAFLALGLIIAFFEWKKTSIDMNYLTIIISAIFVNNIILARFLGICPFLGVSKNTSTAVGMGGAVLFVMTVATISTFLIYHFVLVPLGITYLQTVAYILIIAFLVQVVEIVLKKVSPELYQALGVFLPLITTNCAILGVAILVIQEDFTLVESLVFSIANAAGFTLAIVMFSSIREQMELLNLPPAMNGVPAALVVAGILSMAFMGFAGLFTT